MSGLVSRVLAAAATAAVGVGAILALTGHGVAADTVWGGSVALMLVPLTWSVVGALRRGRIGVDVIALLAMAGCLALGEELAGAVIALMLAGGNELEASANRRARRELTALIERAPRTAHRRRGDRIEEVGVEALAPGDVVVLRTGDVLPVDGVVASGTAVLDESAMTGEPLPVTRGRGDTARSGTVVSGPAFELRATRDAAGSAYGRLVGMVRDARADRAPFVRMADRFALVLLPATLVLAGGAWVLSGDPVRALAVLVVATPCPLILAAPVAIASGLSRAARAGVLVKDGGALERLGRARTVILDKTGTVTLGTPRVRRVRALDGWDADEVLRLAASLDQLSAHVVAEAIVHHAERAGLRLEPPRDVAEGAGQGVAGVVAGRRIVVGSAGWLRARGVTPPAVETTAHERGLARVLVAVDGAPAAVVLIGDRVRPEAVGLGASLHDRGVQRVAIATGDRRDVAEAVGEQIGADEVHADLAPEDKLALIRMLRDDVGSRPIVMVGDGVNDAPALALADVGVAMAGEGDTISAETADAVILVDRVDRLGSALAVGRRSLAIATQSVVAGMALSVAAMIAAAFGALSPVAGALLQEAIDVAVILNALRALRGGTP